MECFSYSLTTLQGDIAETAKFRDTLAACDLKSRTGKNPYGVDDVAGCTNELLGISRRHSLEWHEHISLLLVEYRVTKTLRLGDGWKSSSVLHKVPYAWNCGHQQDSCRK